MVSVWLSVTSASRCGACVVTAVRLMPRWLTASASVVLPSWRASRRLDTDPVTGFGTVARPRPGRRRIPGDLGRCQRVPPWRWCSPSPSARTRAEARRPQPGGRPGRRSAGMDGAVRVSEGLQKPWPGGPRTGQALRKASQRRARRLIPWALLERWGREMASRANLWKRRRRSDHVCPLGRWDGLTIRWWRVASGGAIRSTACG